MSEHFIRDIEIKNYKLFKDFKADGFGRVNLIGGKNNVGKTAFMEAIYINVASKDIERFYTAMSSIKFARENLNILYDDIEENSKKFLTYFSEFNSKSNLNSVYFEIINSDGVYTYLFKINNKEKKINIKDFLFKDKYSSDIEFIDNYGFAYSHIIDSYSHVQRKDKESYLNEILYSFDKQVKSFKIIDNIPMCKLDNQYLELTELGDGIRHLISFISSLFKCENGYLFIDEIENGIHYTQLDRLWEIILTISKQQNVQVFAITHSKECIESFNRVQKKLDDNETYYFEMYRNIKKDNIEMRLLDSNQLEYELTHQGRYRGE